MSSPTTSAGAREGTNPEDAPTRMRIDIWSDIACPWCWLGKHHLQAALQNTGIDAEIEFHSYELDPNASEPRPLREYLAARYGNATAMEAGHERLREMGERAGITFDFDRVIAANTFDAHRVHHLGKTHGMDEPVMERLLRARQGEGADLSDHDTLRRLAVEAGLEAPAVDEVLQGDRFAKEVRADETFAAQNGIQGVPFFVFNGKLAVSGAQPVEVFEDVLRQAQTPLDLRTSE